MSLLRCPKCGEIFTKGKFPICPTCKQKETERLDVLKRFLVANPDASMDEIEKVSGFTHEEIIGYVREGHLSSQDFVQFSLACEECGAKILTGRFCKKCREALAGRLEAGLVSLKTKKKT